MITYIVALINIFTVIDWSTEFLTPENRSIVIAIYYTSYYVYIAHTVKY